MRALAKAASLAVAAAVALVALAAAGAPRSAWADEPIAAGDVISYEVSQTVNKLDENAFTRYQAFSMTDVLPKGLSLLPGATSASVSMTTGGRDITASAGVLTYDKLTREIRYTFSPSYLKSMPLAGETYVMRIKATVDPPQASGAVYRNVARTHINDITLASNEVVARAERAGLAAVKYAVEGSSAPEPAPGQPGYFDEAAGAYVEGSPLTVEDGSKVTYVVRVRQTKQGAAARDVEMSDDFLPGALEIDPGSFEVDGRPASAKIRDSGQGRKSISVDTGKRLEFGEELVLTYSCVADNASSEPATSENAALAASPGAEAEARAPDVVVLPRFKVVTYWREDGLGGWEEAYSEQIPYADPFSPAPEAYAAAAREGCTRLDCWYLDPERTEAAGGTASLVDNLDLYGANICTVEMATARSSFAESHTGSMFADEGLSVPAAFEDRYPEPAEVVYGETVPFDEPYALYYLDERRARTAWSSTGVFARPDASGPELLRVRVLGDAVVYKLWGPDLFDGVVAAR